MATSKKSRKKSKQAKKSKSKKINLPLGKLYAFTVAICLACVLAILFSSVRNGRSLIEEPSSTEKVEKMPPSKNDGRDDGEKDVGGKAKAPLGHSGPMKNQETQGDGEKEKNRLAEKTVEKEPVSAAPLFSVPQAVPGATIVLVIDDAGQSAARTKLYASLPFPLTIAVLPRLPQTRECAEVVRAGGKELILHQPMQAMNERLDPGEGAVLGGMGKDEIYRVVRENLFELGAGVKGMNNHEGSLITADYEKIGYVLDVCRDEGVYFLDSRTTSRTQAVNAAFARGMRIWEKEGPYIDNDVSREKMIERLFETLDYANRHGRAVVIAHVDKSAHILPRLLAEMYPYLEKAGYTFKTPSELE